VWFVVVCVAALMVAPILSRHQWFTHDEWDFLANRDAGSIHDLLRPHNEHWSTWQVLEYRGLYHVVGLRMYLPYHLVLLCLRIAAAALLRVVMRRAGVRPWIATAAAGLFLLLGAAWNDIIVGVDSTFVGAVVFGLSQAILSDHDGPLDRRDWLALLAGLCGLMCGGVALVMVAIVGMAVLARRGLWPAAFQVVPLAVVYGTWYVAIGHEHHVLPSASGHPGLWLAWIAHGILGLFDAFGRFRIVGFAVFILIAVGLWIAWRPLGWTGLRRRASVPAAMLIGSFMFIALTGWTRVVKFHPAYASTSRYVDIAAALAFPALAISVDAVVRRWRRTAPVLVIALLVAVPANVAELLHPRTSLYSIKFQERYKTEMLAIAQSSEVGEVPLALPPDRMMRLVPPGAQYSISLGWLLDAKAAGKLPVVSLSDQERATASVSLALHQTWQVLGKPVAESDACQTIRRRIAVDLQRDESLTIRGGVLNVVGTYLPQGGAQSRTLTFDPSQGDTVQALFGPLSLVLSARRSAQPVTVCGAAAQ
jgi:hypothetical protein